MFAPLRSFAIAALVIPSAAGAFDVIAYDAYLNSLQDQSTEDILDSRSPFGPYRSEVPASLGEVCYLPEIFGWLAPTEGERSLLDRHDFVVSERWGQPSFNRAFEEAWHRDLPVFISSDAILNVLHRSYDDMLSAAEDEYLRFELAEAVRAMRRELPRLTARYRSNPALAENLVDVDVYVGVAKTILDGDRRAGQSDEAQATIDRLLSLIRAQEPVRIPLFNTTPRWVDFSQFKPRGHYDDPARPWRAIYFRAMMWIGRTELRLTPPPVIPQPDIWREVIDARLLYELIESSGAREHLRRIDRVIATLVGPSDNVTLSETDRLWPALGVDSADDLLAPGMRETFDAELHTGAYTAQAILSQIVSYDPFDPRELEPPYAFLPLGQRFILDSNALGGVVFPNIEFQGLRVERFLPTSLDMLYVLGNDDVLPLLAPELDEFHYARNLSALRYLTESFEPEFWRGSFYNGWLSAIRTLSKSGAAHGAPPFMRTGAWQQEKMNTQLASWGELRHDNLLYAKPSYTGGYECSTPAAYVEPIPALYLALENLATDLRTRMRDLELPPPLAQNVWGFFDHFANTMEVLAEIARKELLAEPLTGEETTFLASVVYVAPFHCREGEPSTPGRTSAWEGWYGKLSWTHFVWGEVDGVPSVLVADVHTDPNTKSVLHAGVGAPEMGIFIATPPGGERTAFVGPVSSYYDYVTQDFDRLTDSEWKAIWTSGVPRPDWTWTYLADRSGAVRTGGREVPTTEADVPSDPPAVPSAKLALGDPQPNPFGGSTVFFVSALGAEPVRIEVSVHDSAGRLVRRLAANVEANTPTILRWDGRDERGHIAPPGAYFLRAEGGGHRDERKVIKLK